MESHTKLETSSAVRVHAVERHEYCELITSRRKLERVCGRPGWLRDLETNELFVLAPPPVLESETVPAF